MKLPEIETKSPQEIKAFQEDLLKKQLVYLKQNSPYYAHLFRNENIDIESILSLEDLAKLPLTTKDELQKYNEKFLCVPKYEVADYVSTSGTSGDPVLVALTDEDLDRLAYNESLSYQCAGLDKNSVLQLTTTLDRRFMAGLAYFLGARKAGIGVVRVGSGVPELQWDTIHKIKPDALICVPSFLLKMIEFAEENGIDLKNSSIKKAICIGEPLRNQDFTDNVLAARIKSKWPLELYSTYASTEMATAFTECAEGKGGHLHPELIICEFLDENDQPVKAGAGELVITTLGVKGMPLLRYKTGDIVQPHYEKCNCGRTTLRLGPLVGRKQQMIKYKGTSLYPPALLDLLNDFEEVKHYVIEVYSSEIDEDEIQVKVFSENESEEILDRIKDRFRARVRVSPRILFVSEQEILKIKFPENSRKSITFVDKRKI
ncbi:MAG TPA: AMP-binding protein [Moheibacter sp.]|nr:AMP-binding protein [Moheibacter sp.]